MVKCDCGRHFGSRGNSKGNCPRCNNSRGLVIIKKYSSSAKLREEVSKANTPLEIIEEITIRLRNYEKSIRRDVNISSNNIDRILSLATLEDSTITIDSLGVSIQKLGIKGMSAQDLIESLEASSIILRKTNDTWSVLQ